MADILVYISFDYKDRMFTIRDRLKAIKVAIEEYFGASITQDVRASHLRGFHVSKE